MFEFLNKNKKALAAIILVAFVVYIIYSYGKKSGGQSPLPTDTAGGILTSTEAQQVREMALRIKQDIYGVNIWSRDTEAYYDYAAMSDRLFVAVSNDYKSLTGTSLRADIAGEYYNAQSLQLGGAITAINQRFDRLNIQ